MKLLALGPVEGPARNCYHVMTGVRIHERLLPSDRMALQNRGFRAWVARIWFFA